METQDVGSSNEIRFTNFNSLLSAGPVFEVVGALNLDNTSTLGVGSSSPLKLGTLTTLDHGTINAYSGGIALGTGDTLRGTGFVNGRLSADIGSLIDAGGPLTLGDPASPAGFATRGE